MKTVPKSRHAYVLFANGSPFKMKVVKNKKAYSRKNKHKLRINNVSSEGA